MKAAHILHDARKGRRAVGAFNVSSIEAIIAIFEAAKETSEPAIIQTSAGEAQYLLPELVATICATLSKMHKVDYLLHLDRGNDIDLIKRCLKAGYTSISTEFAGATFDEITAQTRNVRELTKSMNALYEGAIDIVPLRYYETTYQKELVETDPLLAKEFVEKTEVDSLVVSIGNQSGKLKVERNLNIALLKKLNKLLPTVPFVLHGGSFLQKKSVHDCIDNGISKININTEIRLAYTDTLKKNLEQKSSEYAP